MVRDVLTVLSVTASKIKYRFITEIRKDFLKLVPFAGAGQPLPGAVHLTVFYKKLFVIVFVFLHAAILQISSIFYTA